MGEIAFKVGLACTLAAVMLLFLFVFTYIVTHIDATSTLEHSERGWCSSHPEKAADRAACQ